MKLWKQIITSLVIIGATAVLSLQNDDVRNALGFTTNSNAQGSGQRNRNSAVPVIVAEVGIRADALKFNAVGTGRAERSIMLTSEDSGKIIEMRLASGKVFAEGDVMLRLDDKEQKLAVELAKARKAQADRVLQRFESLRQSGNAAIAQLDEVTLAADVARIELDQAMEALENRVLRAPFNGYSGLPLVEQGARVDTETEIASFDDRKLLLVEFDLPEALVPRIAAQTQVSATTPSSPNKTYSGEVVAIDSRITAATRTARARVAIKNEADTLRPGASFTINLQLPGEAYPVVPELAVQFSKGALHVWRVKENKVERVTVTMVRRQDGMVLVDGPLSEGDKVVVEGTQRLSDDKVVTIVKQTATPQASEPAS